jgi:putative membrane protein
MKFLAKIIIAVAVNTFALWAANAYIPGFVVTSNFNQAVIIAVIFSALNLVLKPILKLIFGPVIVLTLGLGIIIVNALILYILDIFSKNLTIETIPTLAYGTILIGLINFVLHLATK